MILINSVRKNWFCKLSFWDESVEINFFFIKLILFIMYSKMMYDNIVLDYFIYF